MAKILNVVLMGEAAKSTLCPLLAPKGSLLFIAEADRFHSGLFRGQLAQIEFV